MRLERVRSKAAGNAGVLLKTRKRLQKSRPTFPYIVIVGKPQDYKNYWRENGEKG